KFDYRACWSFPIKTRENKAIGTMAMYFSEPRAAGPADIALADIATQSAALIISNFIDNKERDLAETALRTSEERLRTTHETAIDFAIINIDADGLVEGWNSGAERLFGFAAHEMIGQPVDIIFTEEDRASHVPEKEMTNAREKGFASDERWHKRKNGSLFFV